ncbi:unnamed protein product, partial [Closterium sp. NIES-54]
VWGSRAFVRDTSTDKLSARAIPCVFLGFVPDAPGWQFYHPTLRRVFPSQDVTFDEVLLPEVCTGAGGAGAGGAGVGGTDAGGAGAAGAGAVDPGAGGAGGTTQPPLLSASPLPTPSPYAEQSGGPTECREPASRPVSPVRTACCIPRSHPPPIPGTHAKALRPSSVPRRVPLPAPLESSLPKVLEPDSDRARAASPTVARLLATAITGPSFESSAASALVAELLDFAAACRLDYATALVAESASLSPPSVGGECALGMDVLEDKQEDFECLAADVPRFASMLLAPEGDPDTPDIPSLRSYAEAITGPYSSQWQAAMDAETASWKSTGTYVDEVPPHGVNIVDGMWIFRVKRPPGSPPAFKARYVARGFACTRRYGCAAHLASLGRFLQVPSGASASQSTVLQRFGFQFSSPQPTPLSTVYSLSAPPSDESVEPSGPYPELVGCLITSGMGLVLEGQGPVVLAGHTDACWAEDSATQRSSQGYTFSLGSDSISWRYTSQTSPRRQTPLHLVTPRRVTAGSCVGHPSLPRLRGMASRVLVSGLPRSLPPLPLGPTPTCVPCVEGRHCAAPHCSTFPQTEAPLQTLHMDVWGPARVRGQGDERYFLLVVDDYSRYTTVFPLRSKGDVTEVLIDWIRAARLQLRESFGSDFPVLRLHSDRGGEFSSARLGAFCRARGIRQTFTLPASPQQNGIAERRIGMVMDVARTSMIHAAAPHFLWPFAVHSTLGQHRPEHMAAAKRVLRYLCSTSGLGLVLGGRRPVVLTGHADASWADDQATQRSSQGYTLSLGSGSVSWRSTRSSFVLGSSCEAEIYAGAMAAQELRWLTYLLTDLGEQPRSPPALYVDNKAMLALCREHRLEHRTKHIALRYFLARELQQRGLLRLAYVASQANTADIFTKALPPGDHQRFCTMLGLVPTLPHLLTS